MDGYSEKPEIEALLAAVKALASPGEVLRGVAGRALDAYRLLGYAEERVAADALAEDLVGVFRRWHKVVIGLRGSEGC